MNNEQINKAVAEGLDVDKQFRCPKCHRSGHWGAGNCHAPQEEMTAGCHWNYCGWSGPYLEAVTRDWFTPSTNLQQAVDHIVPVLNEQYSYDFAIEEMKWYEFHPHDLDKCKWVEVQGQGSTPSERMAWALCEVFLKVKESDHAHIK